jgi:hypothetical protein
MKTLATIGASALASVLLLAPAKAEVFGTPEPGLMAGMTAEHVQYIPQRCRIMRRWEDGELVTIRRCRTPYYGRQIDRRDWDGPPRFYRDWDRPRYRQRFYEGDF